MNNKNIQSVIKDNILSYAGYTIKSRAIPDLRDGNKPVIRKILYAMYVKKCFNYTKSATVTGHVFPYHAHGDCYNTIVGMVQSDNHLTPYVEGKGTFAQHTSSLMQPAASRYTECRLSEIAKDILKDLNKNTVDFIPNYDGTLTMPEVLPVKYPAILHYAQEGIAVGMASKIPSFNLKELNDATIKYIKEGITTTLIPDFATGGYIINQPQAFEKINETGLGSIRLRAKATIDKNIISITEIPYSTTRETIIDKVVELIKSGKLKEITDIKDLTGLHGMEIEITCKKNTDMELLLEKLYLLTPMESSYSCNMNVLHEGLPKVMGVWTIIDKWLEWRKECVKRGLRNEISDLEKKLHLLKGLEKVLLDIDKAIEIIRYSEEWLIDNNLIEYFKVDKTQADYISNMKLRNINKDYITKQIKDIEQLENKLNNLHNTLNCEHLIRDLICEGIQEVTDKYAQDRRSKLITICEKTKEKVVKIKKEIPDYKVRLLVTREGYVKKLSPNTKADQNLKPCDEIVQEYETTNLSELVVFSGKDAYKIKLHQLNDYKPSQLGDYLPNLLGIKNILGYTIVDDNYKYTLILYSNGKIAKIDNNSYKTETNRKKLANSLYKDSEVLQILTIKDDCDINLINNKGKKTMKNTNILMPKKSRNTQGVSTLKNIIKIEETSLQKD